ncbi:hypothetical protein [Chroococcidiopsis sp. CCMEE 29]|jgi:photosystem II stability/assembly factor-like uncharacterized protein|uniref:hypothetical protein n=1 Tax=Chroococcidiopsis sp. CCMEE 29 TaxID=155894 RepID=UPI0020206301|nr:hypothetical protein [Chroococcidiopsis sp. CCMEE 29]
MLPEVDFHALAIAPSDPNIFYGWPASGAQGLHASTDGGKTWTKPRMARLGDAPFSLAVFQSLNGGKTWKELG